VASSLAVNAAAGDHLVLDGVLDLAGKGPEQAYLGIQFSVCHAGNLARRSRRFWRITHLTNACLQFSNHLLDLVLKHIGRGTGLTDRRKEREAVFHRVEALISPVSPLHLRSHLLVPLLVGGVGGGEVEP